MSVATFHPRATVDDTDVRVVDRAVDRAKCGDSEALAYIYTCYADNVYGYVRSIVRDDHEAEDITQHVFAKLMTAIAKYERRSAPFSAWILRVARNQAMDFVRASRSIPFGEVPAAHEYGDDELHERARCLQDAFDSLPSAQRSVLLLRHVFGLSPAEIADCLDRSESSVNGLHHRGRRALQRELMSMGSAPATGR